METRDIGWAMRTIKAGGSVRRPGWPFGNCLVIVYISQLKANFVMMVQASNNQVSFWNNVPHADYFAEDWEEAVDEAPLSENQRVLTLLPS